jgi:glyoxylase I family protein
VRRVGLHHVDIVVSSLERSLPLYRDFLRPLGYVEAYEVVGERGEPVWYLDGEGVGASLGIRQAQAGAGTGHDRYAVGLHHLAFEASSKELVDERFRRAVGQGLEIENEPQGWPYVPGYYATFFHDPDGLKLEVVFVPQAPSRPNCPQGHSRVPSVTLSGNPSRVGHKSASKAQILVTRPAALSSQPARGGRRSARTSRRR